MPVGEKFHLEQKQEKTFAPGVAADLGLSVEISKVHGGYFSNPDRAQEFAEFGLAELEAELPHDVRYADFGGGEGFLAQHIKAYLESSGHQVSVRLVDANERYLAAAKEKTAIDGIVVDLREYVSAEPLDLISTRAVHHYNSFEDQERIMQNIRASLTPDGFYVNQLSSGTDANCELRTALVNSPLLIHGTGGKGYHWTSIREYHDLAARAGFRETKLVGYAKANGWGPEEQWERMNGEKLRMATGGNNQDLIAELTTHRETYFHWANETIKGYIERYGELEANVVPTEESYIVNYEYPIFVSRP